MPTTERNLPRAASFTRAQILGELIGVEERRDGHGFLGFLVDHHAHADAAVGMAAAGQVAPFGLRTVDQIGPVGEGGHEGDREPVADRLAEADLILHVVREMRQRVALRGAALGGDVFIAAREADRLEAEERNLLRIVERELNDVADLLVVDAVDDGDDRHDIDTRVVQVLDGAQLHVEQVSDQTVRVGFVADAVELQIGVAQSGFGGLAAELGALGELDAVGGGLHAVVADLAGVAARHRGRRATASARRRRTARRSCGAA